MPEVPAPSSSALIEEAAKRAALATAFVRDGSDLLRLGAIIPLHRTANGEYVCPLTWHVNQYKGSAKTAEDLRLLVHAFAPDAIALACESTSEFVAVRGRAEVSPFERTSPFEHEQPQTVAIKDERTGDVTWLFRREPYGTRAARRDDRFVQIKPGEFIVAPPSPFVSFLNDCAVLANTPISLTH